MSLILRTKKFPNAPGVYLFRDAKNRVLYVGRASSLKRRVSSYFQKSLNPRVSEMVSRAKSVRHIKTDSLLEAVILEANLIKKHWPKYNIREKDDRSFVYILFDSGEYPTPLIVRGRELQKISKKSKNSRVFGPYQSVRVAKTALHILRRLFPYRTCIPNSGKPCFYFQIGLCPGVCVSQISKQQYRKIIQNLILFLEGKKQRVLQRLLKEDPKRAKYLSHIQDVALLGREEPEENRHAFSRIEGYDVSHLSGKETYGSMVVFENGEAKKQEYRLFRIRSASPSDDLAALQEIIRRRFKHQEWRFPDLILVDGGKPQVLAVSKTLKSIEIKIPLAGISKFQHDMVVYSQGTDSSLRSLVHRLKSTLLKVRDEAHRFALAAHRRRRSKINFKFQNPRPPRKRERCGQANDKSNPNVKI